VNGRDVEPGAAKRDTFLFGCRLYHTESGLAGYPDEDWVRQALQA
jgi:hypothetical protein